MIRYLFLLCGIAHCLPAAILTVTPSVIYNCTGLHGDALIAWTGASSPVVVAVGPDRSALTGPEPGSGIARATGWVTEGLQFFLINEAGTVEATATAHVRCTGSGADAGYFPLAIGNTWVYRVNSRATTSNYTTHKVTGVREIGGRTYFVITATVLGTTAEALLLREQDGRYYAWNGTADVLYLDSGMYPTQPYQGPLGDFPDAIYQNEPPAFQYTDRVFVRGVGLVKSTTTMLSGSSGGFVSGMELIEVRIAGGVHLELPAAQLSLAAGSRRLDVTGRNVTNCAIPCYFVACQLGGADPPGTYKPCTQARVKAQASTNFLTQLELVNAANEVVYRAAPLDAPPGESVRYIQVPLYSAPNVPLPVGEYRLIGKMLAEGQEAASAVMTLEVE